MKAKTIIFLLFINILVVQAQNKICPYVSSGLIAYLGKYGLNTEVSIAGNLNQLELGILQAIDLDSRQGRPC